MDKNHAAGFHEAWERELCKALFHAQEAGKEVTLDERKQIVDAATRRLKASSTNIVCCEYCQERIAQARMDGKDIFAEQIGVRTLLESYGIRLPGKKKQATSRL